jgi:hypothetical protein
MLRQFAGLWLVFFAALAAWQWWGHEHRGWTTALAALALAVGPLGVLRPRFVRPVFVTWMVLVFPVGWVVSHLVLAVLFYGLFTPVGLFFRLVGRDALTLRRRSDRGSYWESKPQVTDASRYFQQF